MEKNTNITKYSQIRLVDTFKPAVEQTNNKSGNGSKPEVVIHFGTNMDILVICAKHKKLSRDNTERIKILLESRE